MKTDIRNIHNARDFDKSQTVTDLKWGTFQYNKKLALATSGGLVLLYNVERSNKGAMSTIQIHDSNRFVSAIAFSPHTNGLLLTGAGDGKVRIWDLRVRTKRPSLEFSKTGDAVRKVMFSPFDPKKLATIYDSGVIQRWDMRKPSSYDKRMNAHTGGLTLDWHQDYDYIVSGGKDKQIQIWNMNSESRRPDYVIMSPNPVSKVRWQVDGQSSLKHGILDSEIASCCTSVFEFKVYVWNPRRPYIPHYDIEDHTGLITDIHWRSDHLLWSVSKDKMFYQHELRNKPRLIDSMPAQAISWSPMEDFSFVAQDRHSEQYSAFYQVNKQPQVSQPVPLHHPHPSLNEEDSIQLKEDDLRARRNPSLHSSLSLFRQNHPPLWSGMGYGDTLQAVCGISFENENQKIDRLAHCADNYIWHISEDCSLEEACEKNSQVAKSIDRHRDSRTWLILKNAIEWEKEGFSRYSPVSQPNANSGNLPQTAYASKITESLRGLSSVEGTPRMRPRSPTSIVSADIRSRSRSRAVLNNSRPGSRSASRHTSGELNNIVAPVATATTITGPTSKLAHEMIVNSSLSESDFFPSSVELTSSSPEDMYMQKMVSSSIKTASNTAFTRIAMKPAKSTYSTKLMSTYAPDAYDYYDIASALNSSALKLTPTNTTSSNTPTILGSAPAVASVVSLPQEAAKYSIQENKSSIEPSSSESTMDNSSGSENETSRVRKVAELSHDDRARRPIQSIKQNRNDMYSSVYDQYLSTLNHPWRAEKLVESAADYSLRQGDIQMCAVLGLLFMHIYPRAFASYEVVEEWNLMYVELLHRQRLFTEAASLIKNSPFESVREMGRVETSLDTICHRCFRPLTDNNAIGKDQGLDNSEIGFWYCSHCKKALDGCIICREPVKGLALCILECGHKIHTHCLDSWTESGGDECPAGCGTALSDRVSRGRADRETDRDRIIDRVISQQTG